MSRRSRSKKQGKHAGICAFNSRRIAREKQRRESQRGRARDEKNGTRLKGNTRVQGFQEDLADARMPLSSIRRHTVNGGNAAAIGNRSTVLNMSRTGGPTRQDQSKPAYTADTGDWITITSTHGEGKEGKGSEKVKVRTHRLEAMGLGRPEKQRNSKRHSCVSYRLFVATSKSGFRFP